MGMQTPVAAPSMLSIKLALRRSIRALRPPKYNEYHSRAVLLSYRHTFEYDQNQANIAQGEEGLLPIRLQNIGQRFPIYYTNRNVTDDSGADDLGRRPFSQGEDEEEGDDDQDFHNCRYDISKEIIRGMAWLAAYFLARGMVKSCPPWHDNSIL